MADLKINNVTPTNIKLGSLNVDKIYQGSILVWPIPISIIKYGYLYNWYTVDDAREISNTDWSVPTRENQKTLSDFLGGNSVAGGKLKETGTTYWDSPNTGATNSSNFNGRGNGERINTTGAFNGLKISSAFWGKQAVGANNGTIAVLNFNSSTFIAYDGVTFFSKHKKYGGNIRLIKDTTTLLDGETSTYTGNDGFIYNTICIGTQEWLSESLIETKYRNGDSIPKVTNNTTWAGLTTGARCSYDNDESNAGE